MECDGFHPKVLLSVTKEMRGEIVEFLEKLERCGKWPQHAFTTMLFLIPKNVARERPIALMPTLIRCSCHLQHPNPHGSSAVTLPLEELKKPCGNFDGNGKIQWKCKGRRSRSGGFGTGPSEGLRACELPGGLGLGDALQVPNEDLADALWVLRAPEASAV